MLGKGDVCPKCGESQMPCWSGMETARACQSCGYVEEKPDGLDTKSDGGTLGK